MASTGVEPILYMHDDYNAEYDEGLWRHTTMRKQASMARQQSSFLSEEDLGNSRLRTYLSV